jgi:heme exporter protein B
MSFLRGVLAILAKDIAVELRSKETFSAMLVFALLVTVVFSFALELRVDNAGQMAPGILWVAIAFAGVLGLNRSFLVEREGACIEGLMLSPLDRSVIYTGKLLANVLFMLVAETFILPVLAVLFDVPIFYPGLWLILFLGTLGLAAVGTLFAAMTVSTRARDIMLPLLLFPVIVPVIIAATKSTGLIFDGRPLTEAFVWMRLMSAFDVVFVVIAVLGFEYVVEE